MAPSASRSPRLTLRWLPADTRTRSRYAKAPAEASTGSAISASPQTRARRANDYRSRDGRQPQAAARNQSSRCLLHPRNSLVALRIFETQLVLVDWLDEPQASAWPADDPRQHARALGSRK